MGIFNTLFGWIGKLLKKIWNAIKKILPFILLAVAIWLALGLPFAIEALGISIAGTQANALLLAGASFLFAPQETGDVIGKALDSVGDTAGDVISTVTDVVSDGATTILSSPIGLVGIGLLLYFLFFKDDDKKVVQNSEGQT